MKMKTTGERLDDLWKMYSRSSSDMHIKIKIMNDNIIKLNQKVIAIDRRVANLTKLLRDKEVID